MAHGEIKTEILSWEELILGDLSGHSHHVRMDLHSHLSDLSTQNLNISPQTLCTPHSHLCKDLAGDPWLSLNDSGIQWTKFWPEILNYPRICGFTWSLSCTWLFSEAHCYHLHNFSNACLQKIIAAGLVGSGHSLIKEWTKKEGCGTFTWVSNHSFYPAVWNFVFSFILHCLGGSGRGWSI